MPALCLHSAGSNARGQLGTGNLEDAHRFTPCVFIGCELGALPDQVVAVDQIACGANHTMVLLKRCDGVTELWGCGDGSRGQLGPSYLEDVDLARRVAPDAPDATAMFRPLRLDLHVLRDLHGASLNEYTVRLIAAGWETSYVVLSCPGRDDVLLSMGADDFGNLGVGGVRTRNTVEGGAKSTVHVVRLRDSLPLENTEGLLSVLILCSGPHHTVAHVRLVRPNGSTCTYLVGWGTARHGQLGPVDSSSKRLLPFISSPQLISLPQQEPIAEIGLGNQHTVLLHSSGTLTVFGSNRKDQTSGLDTLNDVRRIGCTWNGTYALTGSGRLLATGSDTHSQLGRGTAGRERQGALGPVRFPFEPRPGQIVLMACGSEHVLCVIEAERAEVEGQPRREVWGWGWNEHGNLGTGGTDDVDVPVKIWPGSPGEHDRGRVLNVWAGCGTSWILVER
ncbi:RCC1/BLIP-II [Trametes punicea]|nr:RCC1/BLIP-II [Trametes punicea]